MRVGESTITLPESAPVLKEHLSFFLQAAPVAAVYVGGRGSQGRGERTVSAMEPAQQKACLGNWLKTLHPVE